MTKPAVTLFLALSLVSCQATSVSAVVDADESVRAPLFAAVAGLEGRWEGQMSDGSTVVHEFAVTANGSVVREIVFPGTPTEMTNMYVLDGNVLTMTHYCAAGNQPRMRASSIEGGRLVFEPVSVSDLNSEDEVYMGAMTLVLVDADHMQQDWTSFTGGEAGERMSMELTRVR